MSKPIETVELVKPAVPISARDLLAATFARPGAVVAYAIPMALASAVSFAVVVAATSEHMVYGNYLPQFVDVPVTTSLALLLTLVPLMVVVHLFAAAAVELVICARLLSRTVSVLSAWGRSARLLSRTLPLALPAVIVSAVALSACYLLIDNDEQAWISVAILIAVFMFFYPLLYIFSIATITALPVSATWREVRAVGRAVNDAGLLARIPLLISLGLGAGLIAALLAAARLAPVTAWNTLLFGSAVLLVLALTVVRAIGVISRLTLEGLSRQQPPHSLDLPAQSERSRPRGAAGWLVAAAAILLPFTILAGAIATNPTNVTTASVLDIGNVDATMQTIELGPADFASLSNSYTNYTFAMCIDATCHPGDRAEWYGYGNALAANPAGGALAARWLLDDDSGEQIWTLEVGDFSSDALLAAKEVSEDGFRPPRMWLEAAHPRTIDTVTSDAADPFSDSYPDSLTDLVINTSGEYPVIASLHARESGEDLLTLYRCVDAQCSSATKQSTVASWDSLTRAMTPLDVAVAPDGTVYMTLSGFQETREAPSTDDTALIIAVPGKDMTVTRIIENTNDGGWGDDNYRGSRIVLNNEGLPIVLTRLGGSGTFQLLTCADAMCSASTTQNLPGFTSAEYLPAITVDATGRPLIATYSSNGKSVIVLSCVDSACTDFESRIVAPASRINPPLAITVTSAGLPVVTISNVWIHEIRTFLYDPTRIVLCQQPRCGAK